MYSLNLTLVHGLSIKLRVHSTHSWIAQFASILCNHIVAGKSPYAYTVWHISIKIHVLSVLNTSLVLKLHWEASVAQRRAKVVCSPLLPTSTGFPLQATRQFENFYLLHIFSSCLIVKCALFTTISVVILPTNLAIEWDVESLLPLPSIKTNTMTT